MFVYIAHDSDIHASKVVRLDTNRFFSMGLFGFICYQSEIISKADLKERIQNSCVALRPDEDMMRQLTNEAINKQNYITKKMATILKIIYNLKFKRISLILFHFEIFHKTLFKNK